MKYATISDDLPAVSAISLGSWNTFSRIPFEELIALLQKAIDAGINFFDVGFYWDKPYTEVIFGRAMQVLNKPRQDYILSEKLWLWDYPERSFEEQLRRALVRLGTAYVDVVMVSRPLPTMDFDAFCLEIMTLVENGLARSWGVTNWSAQQIARAQQISLVPRLRPRLAQLQYNVCRRTVVESTEFSALFANTDIRLCAAFTLEGGILAGHLDRDRVQPSEFAQGKVPVGRNIARDSGDIRENIRQLQPLLEKLAKVLGVSAAQAAVAFCLTNPGTATALVGVTKQADLADAVDSLKLLDRRDEVRRVLAPLAVAGAAQPKLFNPHNDE